MGEISGLADYIKFIERMKEYQEHVGTSFELQVTLDCITSAVGDYIFGSRNEDALTEGIADAYRKLKYADEMRLSV